MKKEKNVKKYIQMMEMMKFKRPPKKLRKRHRDLNPWVKLSVKNLGMILNKISIDDV